VPRLAAPPSGSAWGVMDVRVEARSAAAPTDWDRRSTVATIWWGRAVVVVAILAALATLVVNGDGLSLGELASSPHLLDIDVLSSDPVRSIWFLHAQVPVHNAVVGLVGWLPVPLVGTLFLLHGAAVLATGLLLHAVLVRWGTPPLVAGGLAALAMVNPALLDTIRSCGAQVPVALLVVAALYLVQRYLDRPRGATLLLLSFVLTAGTLTWHMLRPLWVVAILAIAVLARSARRSWYRTLGWLVAALVIPVVLIGGWALKNEAVFGEPTLASSVGFDLHQGVTGPMSAAGVAGAVEEGTVAPLAQQQPWGTLGYYGPDRGGTGICFPAHRHRATVDMGKAVPDDRIAPNYNNECYLPLYRQARHDALTLALRYPGRYLTTRDAGLVLAYDTADGCAGEPCTWMDRLYQPLLGKVDGQVTMYDWNLRLFGTEADHLDVTLSMVLVVASAAVGWRGLVAVWRLRRIGWRSAARAEWPSGELLWVVAAATVVLVIAGTALVEVGDNGRMRTALDPVLLTLPVAAFIRVVWRSGRRSDAGSPPTVPSTTETGSPAPSSEPSAATGPSASVGPSAAPGPSAVSEPEAAGIRTGAVVDVAGARGSDDPADNGRSEDAAASDRSEPVADDGRSEDAADDRQSKDAADHGVSLDPAGGGLADDVPSDPPPGPGPVPGRPAGGTGTASAPSAIG